jgi:hypothetical protein
MGDVKITWNKSAIEQVRKQAIEGAAEEALEKVTCPKCETSPRLRAHGRYFCECGEFEGVVTEK